MSRFHLLDRIRSVAADWQAAAAIVGSAVVCEVGARVGLPGVDGSRVREFFHAAHGGVLSLYNLLVGGAVSRAAVLALGLVPYFQAEFYLWLARAAFPAVRRATAGPFTRRRVVRFATVGLAAVQSFGFALFLQRIPGAVANPGVGFMARTILLVTGGAALVGWLADAIARPARDFDVDLDDVRQSSAPPRANPVVESSNQILRDAEPVPRLLEAGMPFPTPRAQAVRTNVSTGRSNEH
jgi:hypothetical protein